MRAGRSDRGVARFRGEPRRNALSTVARGSGRRYLRRTRSRRRAGTCRLPAHRIADSVVDRGPVRDRCRRAGRRPFRSSPTIRRPHATCRLSRPSHRSMPNGSSALHPDLVVGIPAQAALVADLRRVGLRAELLPDDSFDDIFSDLARLGALSGHAREAARACRRVARAHGRARARRAGRRPPAYVRRAGRDADLHGRRPLVHRTPDRAGRRPQRRGRSGRRLRTLQRRSGRRAQPDVIVTDRGAALTGVLGRAPWNALRAVREKPRLRARRCRRCSNGPGPATTTGSPG